MQPIDIAIELRRRTPWEAMDLGLAMLQRWARQAYLPHLLIGSVVAALAWGFAAWLGKPFLALLLVWWLKPLYDRVVLHVLSRAVFGEVLTLRQVLRDWRDWLGAGLFAALLFRWWPDLQRSFSLPVRQLEGQRARAGRERRTVLGRRVGNYAVWLTIACMHFEAVLYWSFNRLASLFLPAKSLEARDFMEAFFAGELFTTGDFFAYAAAVLVLEPFYVAAGFALYLNRRTLLEGWDIEVALRKITQRHAAPALLAACLLLPLAAFAAEGDPQSARETRDPRREIAEVLKSREFPHQVDTMQWRPKRPWEQGERKPDAGDGNWMIEAGRFLAVVLRALFWLAVGAAVVYAIWWLVNMLPRMRAPAAEPYRPPAALFGMEIAPEKLPADVGAAAAALARAGRVREALALLYRGALSHLVHRRGVELLASHTELEALRLAQKRLGPDGNAYLSTLVRTWRECAYARRAPSAPEVERLAGGFKVMAAA